LAAIGAHSTARRGAFYPHGVLASTPGFFDFGVAETDAESPSSQTDTGFAREAHLQASLPVALAPAIAAKRRTARKGRGRFDDGPSQGSSEVEEARRVTGSNRSNDRNVATRLDERRLEHRRRRGTVLDRLERQAIPGFEREGVS
jgi:hypothetical protein